ncbi:S-layer homology domain-containing protein [Paenibacillus sp. CC-CFT747]|nr:S-layer homology domain-containing protein [Paenibacillus sp. CC-CFT747]
MTGEWKKRESGQVTTPGKPAATDIEGHWAERELRLMLDYDAIDTKDGKVTPDQSITRGEMIKMLMIAIRGGDTYAGMYDTARSASFKDVANGSAFYPYVEAALEAKLIDRGTGTFDPESRISREDLAVLLVRALGYNNLADQPDLFNLKVSDAGAITHKGQVAIVTSLGIMSPGDDGSFEPGREVTRAQAAVAFYRYLEKRADLTDRSPLR